MGAEASTAQFNQPGPPAPVMLHVYDLGQNVEVQAMNVVLGALGSGAFHCGIEVYGQEFSFNWKPQGSGVFRCRPRQCPGHSYRTSIHMGDVDLTFEEVEGLMSRLKAEWPGSSYHILNRNCCTFCDAFCRLVGLGPIPYWTRNLADAGSVVNSAYNAVAGVPLTVRAAVNALGDEIMSYGVDLGCVTIDEAPVRPPKRQVVHAR
mmetsp:Transcript_19487/g.39295  ORF Transcript_19487/g.39295 Transcript_19487/m.39295 type:complete len:205 (-) Transcript_19487:312-926(-)